MSQAGKQRSKSSIVNEPVMFVLEPWSLVVTETEVILAPRPVPWNGIGLFCGLFILFCGLLAMPVVVWGEPDQRWVFVALIVLVAVVTCSFTTAIVYYSYRAAQYAGPQLFIDRAEQIVHVPRHGLSVPIAQVDHLQVRNDMPDEDGKFMSETCISELVLMLHEDNQVNQYSIIECYQSDYYDPLARELASLNIVPVKRIKGVPGSTLVYEKWLTPLP